MAHFTRVGVAGLALALQLSTPAAALSVSEIEKRDFDKDGFIERGEELDALNLLRDQFNGRQIARYTVFLDSGDDKIAVSDFDTRDYYEQLAAACGSDQSFFLQESISQISLHHLAVVVPSKQGAVFSINQDRLANITTWQVKGTAAWLPSWGVDRCLYSEATQRPQGVVLTAFGLAPYISFSGTGNSNAPGTSNLTMGALSQFQFFGGAFDVQELSLAPSYRTDFQGKAEIYGIQASWRPYHFESRLNGLQGDIGSRYWDWSLGADVDYLNVQKAGNSGLSANSQYAWFGGIFGLGYSISDVGVHGLRLSADVEAHYDLVNDISAVKYSTGAVLGLSEDKRTSLELKYENGKDYQTLQKVNGVKLNLRLAF